MNLRSFKEFDYWLLGTRTSGILLFAASLLQLFYFVKLSNNSYPVFSSVFLIAMFCILFSTFISVVNSWFYSKPIMYKVKKGAEPKVAVVIPTSGEEISMVLKTVESVVLQNYPLKKLLVVISDDAKNAQLEQELKRINALNPNILYYRPPHKTSIFRVGYAKAGNLNSVLAFVLNKHSDIQFIETRDADDLVSDPNFLRYSIGSLLADKKLSYVQSIKTAQVSKNDPFLNKESLFYETTMRYKAAVNSVFPCGSGLVWRIRDLIKISGFPSWNLVEDLQSGYDLLKRGGKGEYLPIVGAKSQIAPEDIPNYYKQRGTWAIDSLRLFFWDNAFFAKKLTIFQKIQFFEMGYSYLLSVLMWFLIFTITACLGNSVCPTTSNSSEIFIINLIFIYSVELFNIIRSRGFSYSEIWKARQTWIGLIPIFTKATIEALIHGPNKKPLYRVTRKKHLISFYWQEVLIQFIISLVLGISIIIKLVNFKSIIPTDIIMIFWALYLIYGFSRVIKNSFHGFNPSPEVKFLLSLNFSRKASLSA